MAAASTSESDAPEDETLATPVGGNALNPEGEATHDPDRLGAGTPSGTPEAEAPDTATTDDSSEESLPAAATTGEGDALDNDEIEEQADNLES
jgi:hypothetical protein